MLNPLAADEAHAFRYLLLLTHVYPLLKACAQDGVGPPTQTPTAMLQLKDREHNEEILPLG